VFITSRSRSSSVRASTSPAGEALAVLGLELVDLPRGDPLELGRHRLARLKLPRVDQDGPGAVDPATALHVGEERELSGHEDRLAVGRRLLLPAGDEVEDQLGDVGVVADDDEHRRRHAGLRHPGLPPALERLLVVAVEAVQGALELCRRPWLALDGRLPPSLPGKLVADLAPQLPVGDGGRHPVVVDRHAGDLDDA
jgi:hypothetical protein